MQCQPREIHTVIYINIRNVLTSARWHTVGVSQEFPKRTILHVVPRENSHVSRRQKRVWTTRPIDRLQTDLWWHNAQQTTMQLSSILKHASSIRWIPCQANGRRDGSPEEEMRQMKCQPTCWEHVQTRGSCRYVYLCVIKHRWTRL